MESVIVLVLRVDRILIAEKIINVVLMDVKMTVYHQVWKNTVKLMLKLAPGALITVLLHVIP